MEVYHTSRGKNCISFRGFSYTERRRSNGYIYWRCRNRKVCSGTMVTLDVRGPEGYRQPAENIPHSHPPNVDAVAIEKTKSTINHQAANQLTPIPQIYRENQVQLLIDHEEAVGMLPSFRSLASSAYRSRKRNLPPLPRRLADLHIEDVWTQSVTGDQFLLFDETLADNRNRIVCFCTEVDLRQLCDVDTLYMDGTFSTAPHLFMQLYTIHGFVEGKQLPLVYALLTGKTAQIYTELFRHLKNKAAELQTALNPVKIMTDFETGVRRALMTEFPQAEHKGCYFHFTQSVYRQVKAIGLQAVYNDEAEPQTRNYVRKIMATAFLPPREVAPAVQALFAQAPVIPRIQDFNDYFNATWLAGHFPVEMWNVHREERRTNNDVEGWHNALTRMVAKSHPNIWELIICLKKQQATVTATRLQIQAGVVRGVRQPRYIRLNERLQRLTDQYVNGLVAQMHFLQAVAHTIAAPL